MIGPMPAIRMFDRASQHIVAALCALIFCIAAGLSISSGDALHWPDENDYQQLAEDLMAGKGYVNVQGQPTAHRPPGYPFILATVYSVSHHPVAAKLLNALALALTAWLLAGIVASVMPQGAVFAPLLILFNPLMLFTSTTLLPQTLGTLFFVLAVYGLLRHPDAKIITAAAGLLYGLLIIIIPTFLMILPLLVVLLLAVNRRSKTYSSSTLAVFFICAILALSPWTLRNTLLFGKIVPVATNSGENLLMGNSINARPNSGANVDMSPYARPGFSSMSEVERDTYLRNAAVGWITQHPADAFNLYLRKLLNYFNFRNELSTSAQASSFRETLLFVTYYPLLALAVVRLFWRRKYPVAWQEMVLYGLYLGSAFASAIFFTRIRYRIPFDALLIAIVAIFLGYIFRQYVERTSPEKFMKSQAGL